VFDVPDNLGFDNVTLLQALNFGGSGKLGKQQTLLRLGVASLLNASSLGGNYPLTTQQVIDAVNAALATSGTQDDRDLANTFQAYITNLPCPIS